MAKRLKKVRGWRIIKPPKPAKATSKPDLTGIYNPGLLNQVLSSKGLAVVQGP